MMLNLMISHKLADVIYNDLIETLTSVIICFRAFYFVCKSFCSQVFMNENDIIYIYIYIYIKKMWSHLLTPPKTNPKKKTKQNKKMRPK
jgi:hypothetical protein